MYTRSPPKTECGCLHAGVIENGRGNPLTIIMDCTCTCTWCGCGTCTCTCTGVDLHILGDRPSVCSAEESYKNNIMRQKGHKVVGKMTK